MLVRQCFSYGHFHLNGLAHLRAGIGEVHSETSVIEICRSIPAGGAQPRPSGGAGVGRLLAIIDTAFYGCIIRRCHM